MISSSRREPRRTELSADSGERVEVVDVVLGRHGEFLGAIDALHVAHFPDHDYVRSGIVTDARRSVDPDGFIVHQWVLLVDDEPVGYSLADTNLLRGVAPNHFLAVDRRWRSLTIDGTRLGTWFLHYNRREQAIDVALARDGNPDLDCFGAVAETPEEKLGIFLTTGWRRFPVDYVEPVHGWEWREKGEERRRVALLWLPADERDVAEREPEVARAAAAAFLLDMYELDTTDPQVAALVGDEVRRGAIRRR